jgi:hypothetical protein
MASLINSLNYLWNKYSSSEKGKSYQQNQNVSKA